MRTLIHQPQQGGLWLHRYVYHERRNVQLFKACINEVGSCSMPTSLCRFRYRPVPKQTYGLDIVDLLQMDAKELNQACPCSTVQLSSARSTVLPSVTSAAFHASTVI
jgi:hypothetical protein